MKRIFVLKMPKGPGELQGDGVFELKIDYGPGYRVYLGQDGITLVIILAVGTKSTQPRDIAKAKKMWKSYQERCK